MLGWNVLLSMGGEYLCCYEVYFDESDCAFNLMLYSSPLFILSTVE